MNHPGSTVFWGYDLGPVEKIDYAAMPQWWLDHYEDDRNPDWDDVLATRLGWVEAPFPTGEPSKASVINGWYVDPDYYAYWNALSAKKALLYEIGVEIGVYGDCQDGKGSQNICVSASIQGHCGIDAQELTPLVTHSGWTAQIERFCTILEIPIPLWDPSWYICGWVG